MGLSLSEIFSVVHILVAIFSLAASVLLMLAIPFPQDMYTFVFASLLIAVTVTYLAVGVSTWLATPSAGQTRWDVLLFILSVFWCVTLALLIALVLAYPRYMGEKIMGYFDRNIFYDEELAQIQIGFLVGAVATVVVVVSNVALTGVILYKHFKTPHEF